MWPKQTQLAFVLSLAIFCSSPTHAAAAQAKRVSAHSYIRVVSVRQDVSGNFVLLNTLSRQQLPRPTIHFLTTSDGVSIMTADFNDTILCAPASSFVPAHSQLQRVHVGQLQAAPPIVRITFETKAPDVFKRIDFGANVGCLTLRLPISKRAYEQSVARAATDKKSVAPSAVSNGVSKTARNIDERPPSAKSDGSTVNAFGKSKGSAILAAPSSLTLRTTEQMPPVAHAPGAGNWNGEVQGTGSAIAGNAGCKPPLPSASRPPSPVTDPNKPQLRGPISLTEEQLQATVTDATYERIDTKTPQHSSFGGALKRMLGMHAANVSSNQNVDNGSKPSSSPVRAQSNKATPSVASADAGAPPAVSPPPTPELRLTTSGADPLTMQIVASKAVTYKTFRLHQPERLVIDIAAASGAPKFIPTQIPRNELIKSFRVGSPDGSPEVTRLVADLNDPRIAISQDAGAKPNALALTLSRLEETAKTDGTLNVPANAFIVLDAGHGGHDPGAQRGDIQEKELTLDIVDKLKRILQSKGIRVKLTRSDDTFVSLEDRVNITNTAQPNAFVSVHINSMQTDNGAHGIETYFQNERSGDLAKLLHQSLVSELNAPDRSVRKARFYVINHTPLPAVLCEVGFISNKDEREKLASSDYQSHIAEALANGVMLYLAQQKTGSGSGTMPDETASASAQSFTQNLHSKVAAQVAQKSSKTPVSSAKKVAESPRNTKIKSASSAATMQ